MLAGCEKSDETVSLYQNADDCSAANPGKSAECTTAYNNALKEAERTAPKYATREDCVAEFGEGQCQQAPAQAGMAPENQAQAQQSSGSFWMPLMAGYMMGRLMGGGAGFAQQPLFSSKTRPALHTANIPMRQVKLRRGATGPDNDRTENRDGAETCHHNNRYPRRFWRIRRQTEHHAA